MVTITFPDGNKKKYREGVTALEIAADISEGLARNVLAAKVDEKVLDATLPINNDAKIQLLTVQDAEGLNVLRHSAAHLLAHAVQRLYPEALPTIGPVIDNGFYYDFDKLELKEEDLGKLEAEMKKIVKEKHPVTRTEHKNKQEALELYKKNPYKEELIKDLDKGSSTYTQGDFHDLCRGPHTPSTGSFKNAGIKLDKIAGAYWRGDSNNQMLTRIYGLCFATKKELNEYLELRTEAEKRDHRKIGKEQELIMFHEYSPGSPFFLFHGATIYNELLAFVREEYTRRKYQEVITPLLYDKELWMTSGHWEHYREDMFIMQIDGRDFSLKPMNCPSHCLIYKNSAKSYRDLPLRIADFAALHRNELRGVLSGLTRVRKFSQDDSHTFCTEEQIEQEVIELLDFVKHVYSKVFDFDYSLKLGTRPTKFMGDEKLWDKAEQLLEQTLEKKSIPFKIDKEEGAFYGPKIDIKINDALGREWQLATIQLDFQLPQRFKLQYEGKDGTKHQPIMIHKAILGSLERFMGILIEHFAGKFPLWLSPVQAKILPIADRHAQYAEEVADQMRKAGLRIEVDARTETINKKVREAQLEHVNYILVVGDKEMEEGTVTVRTRDEKVHGAKKVPTFINQLRKEVQERKLPDY